jgi:hypothetical protein
MRIFPTVHYRAGARKEDRETLRARTFHPRSLRLSDRIDKE